MYYSTSHRSVIDLMEVEMAKIVRRFPSNSKGPEGAWSDPGTQAGADWCDLVQARYHLIEHDHEEALTTNRLMGYDALTGANTTDHEVSPARKIRR